MSSEHEIKAGVDLGAVRALIAPAFADHGVSLVDLEWLTERGGWTLRVTIERVDAGERNKSGPPAPGFGVTLDDCTDVSRSVSALLDQHEGLFPHRYNLEVSSPGLDRPLRTEADFARFAGQTAKVKLKKAAPDGQKLLRGPLAEAEAGKVAVVVDGKRIEVPFADVAEAELVFELVSQPKGPPKKTKAGGKQDKRDKREQGGRG
ncbi:MAG: ribosome maturation factor RimP [Byssovorax sp.]